MKFSKDTLEVLDFLENVFEQRLLKREDLGFILELGASFGEHELVTKIIFSGTSVRNLSYIIQQMKISDEGYDIIKKEFNDSFIELINLLKDLVRKHEVEENNVFEEKYFVENVDSQIENIIDLSHDFSLIKKIQSEIKSID